MSPDCDSETLLHHSRHKKRFLTQQISNTTRWKSCLHWCNTVTSKYGLSCRCSQIHLLCSFWVKSRVGGSSGSSQFAREKSLWAWVHSDNTPQESPGHSNFTTSRAKPITSIQYGLHLVNHYTWIIISFNIFVPGSVLHFVGSVLFVPFLLHSLHFIIVADQ